MLWRFFRFGQQQADQIIALENVWKDLNVDESVTYLQTCLSNPQLASAIKIIIPNTETFAVDQTPAWDVGVEIPKSSFESIIHLDLGIFLLHKGSSAEALVHFQQQQMPLENFPFLKISKRKMEGYLRSVGLLTTFDQTLEDSKVTPRSLDHAKMLESALSVRKGLSPRLKKLLNVKLDPPALPRGQDRLNPDQRDTEEGAFIIPG